MHCTALQLHSRACSCLHISDLSYRPIPNFLRLSYLSVCLSAICLFVSVCLSIHPSVHPLSLVPFLVCLSYRCLSLSVFLYLPVSICLYVSVSISLSIYLSPTFPLSSHPSSTPVARATANETFNPRRKQIPSSRPACFSALPYVICAVPCSSCLALPYRTVTETVPFDIHPRMPALDRLASPLFPGYGIDCTGLLEWVHYEHTYICMYSTVHCSTVL